MTRYFKTSLALLFFNITLCIFTTSAFAATPDEQKAIEQSIQNQQRIEQERQDLVRQKEMLELQNINKLKPEKSEPELGGKFFDNGACKVIDKFILVGNSRISSQTLRKKFIQKHQGICVNKTNLKEIKDGIATFYLKKGYILARVYFDVKDVDKGTLTIAVEEGKIAKISATDNSKINEKLSFRRSLQTFFAFPFLKKKPLNLADIDQGVDQINRLSSSSATMKIEPAEQDGYSNVVIDNKISHISQITISHDNSGSESTGKYKNKFALNQDNLLGINDNLYINYSTSNNTDKSYKYSKSLYLSGSVPFGYYTLGGSYSYSHYLSTVIGSIKTFETSGNSESRSFYLDRVLSRGKKYKVSAKAELENSDSDNYVADTYLPATSRRLTSANFYLTNTFYTKNNTIFLQPYYNRGLRALGALRDSPSLSRQSPKAQYQAFGLYGSVSSNFNIPKTKIPLNHNITFDIKESKDSLYSIDQFTIGGRYTVRGFEETQISGDGGYYIRNDLKINSTYLFPELFKKSQLFNLGASNSLSLNNVLSKTTVGVFYDYGYARKKIVDEDSDKGYLSGAGLKVNYSGKFFDWDVTYSRALHSPRFVRNIDNLRDKESIYFNLSLKVF